MEALYKIGFCYEEGEEINFQQSYDKAAYWYEKAAEKGNVDAQIRLGLFYQEGYSVEKDYEKAVYWYEKAAEKNSIEAQYRLAQLYQNDDIKNYEEAIYWYEKVIKQDNYLDTQINLRHCYYLQGYYEKAFYCYEKLAEQGIALGQRNLGVCYQ